jgi:replicative DNA helicase
VTAPRPLDPDRKLMLRLIDGGQELQSAAEGLEQAKAAQMDAARERLYADYTDAPTLGYPDLVQVTGPMLKGQLWIVLARQKNGKTSFLMNVASRWLGKGIGFAYFGTEESADAAMLRFASIRTGHNPGDVVAGHASPEAIAEVDREMTRLHGEPVYFAPDTRPSFPDIERVANAALALDLPILVLDHFHRMAVLDGPSPTAQLAETVRRIKQLAVETELTIVMAAQAKRGADPMHRFYPPPSDGGLGTSALEQECDVMVGLYRPLQKGIERGAIAKFLAGELQQSDVIRPHTMGVKVLEHRRNGDLAGETVYLHIENGLVASQYRVGGAP